MRLVIVVVLTGSAGCDLVFGLTDQPAPCSFDDTFESAKLVKLADADDFSIASDRSLAVVQLATAELREVRLPDGSPIAIDLGIYNSFAFAMSPEGDSLMYTSTIEPPVLRGAVRVAGDWLLDRPVPRGTFAGVPSADAFGPRRVLVRLRDAQLAVQEYVDVAGVWTAAGDPFELDGLFAPSLTPSGLSMVYSGFDADELVVRAASRDSTDEPFAESRVIFRGAHRAPQLLGNSCEQLFISVDGELRRYDR